MMPNVGRSFAPRAAPGRNNGAAARPCRNTLRLGSISINCIPAGVSHPREVKSGSRSSLAVWPLRDVEPGFEPAIRPTWRLAHLVFTTLVRLSGVIVQQAVKGQMSRAGLEPETQVENR